MRVCVAAVGGLKEAYWRGACAEYAKRLERYCRFSIVEAEECRLPDKPSPAQVRAALEDEGKRLLAKTGGKRVALCVEGQALSSPGLAAWLDGAAADGGEVSFLIGGSWGLSDEVKAAAALRLSMSAMTFPHQLARVLLCEQVYRAFSIRAGGKYHK